MAAATSLKYAETTSISASILFIYLPGTRIVQKNVCPSAKKSKNFNFSPTSDLHHASRTAQWRVMHQNICSTSHGLGSLQVFEISTDLLPLKHSDLLWALYRSHCFTLQSGQPVHHLKEHLTFFIISIYIRSISQTTSGQLRFAAKLQML